MPIRNPENLQQTTAVGGSTSNPVSFTNTVTCKHATANTVSLIADCTSSTGSAKVLSLKIDGTEQCYYGLVFGNAGFVGASGLFFGIGDAGNYILMDGSTDTTSYVATTNNFGGTCNHDSNVKLTVAGAGYYVKEGSNATMGVATLVGGTATVNTTKVTANSRIFLTHQNVGGTVGAVGVSARTAGTSFTITSLNVLDTSAIAWLIMEPA